MHKQNIFSFFSIITFLLIILFLQDTETPSVNQNVYWFLQFMMPYTVIFLIFFSLEGNKIEISIFEKKFILVSITIVILFAIIGALNPQTDIKIVFWKTLSYVSPIIAGFSISRIFNFKNQITFLFKAICFASILSVLRKLDSLQDLILYFNLENLIFGKNLKLESDLFAFIFGILFIYFFTAKSKFFSIISFVFLILTGKRIVILGIVAALLMFFISKKKSANKLKYLLSVANLILLWVTFLQASSNRILEDLSMHYFDMPLNTLNAGRSMMYESVINTLQEPKLIGNGIGVINSILIDSFKDKPQLFHSDLLRIAYEIGILGFLMYIYSLYSSIKINIKLLPFIVLLNVYFITDNVIEYFPVMFIFYTVFFIYTHPKSLLQKINHKN